MCWIIYHPCYKSPSIILNSNTSTFTIIILWISSICSNSCTEFIRGNIHTYSRYISTTITSICNHSSSTFCTNPSSISKSYIACWGETLFINGIIHTIKLISTLIIITISSSPCCTWNSSIISITRIIPCRTSLISWTAFKWHIQDHYWRIIFIPINYIFNSIIIFIICWLIVYC